MKISKLLRVVTTSLVAGSVLVLASCADQPQYPPPTMKKGWNCAVRNIKTQKKWWGSAPYRKQAMRQAYKMCRMHSAMESKYCRPMSCKKIY